MLESPLLHRLFSPARRGWALQDAGFSLQCLSLWARGLWELQGFSGRTQPPGAGSVLVLHGLSCLVHIRSRDRDLPRSRDQTDVWQVDHLPLSPGSLSSKPGICNAPGLSKTVITKQKQNPYPQLLETLLRVEMQLEWKEFQVACDVCYKAKSLMKTHLQQE